MTAVLDAGALIAVDRRDRAVGAMLRLLHNEGVPVLTSAAVVAQVWRTGRQQANLARTLSGCEIAGIEAPESKRIGELLAANRTSDIADAHVALLVRDGDRVLTSDAADISALLQTRQVRAKLVDV